jgi:CRP-like cAMP-binding protein
MKETFTITPHDTALIQQYGLAPEKLQNCSVRSYSFGERIISEGRPNGLLFIITGGKAKVGVTAPNGKNIVLCFYISKGLLGEVELFSDTSAASTTVTAMNELRCIVIPTDRNKAYLLGNPAFTRIAASQLSEKLMQSTDKTVENTLYTAEIRLCRYIFAAANNALFRDVMTDVSYSIGTSYRHLYRMIGALCKDRILEKTNEGYRICNMEQLKERAGQH